MTDHKSSLEAQTMRFLFICLLGCLDYSDQRAFADIIADEGPIFVRAMASKGYDAEKTRRLLSSYEVMCRVQRRDGE